MRTLLLLFFICVFSCTAFSQNGLASDYYTAFNKLYNFAVEQQNTNPDSASIYGREAVSIAEKNDDDTLRVKALLLLSAISVDINDNENAGTYLRSAIKILSEINDDYRLAKAYLDLGNVYENSGSYDEAIEEYNKALSIYRSVENYKDEANALNRIGVVYKYKGDYPTALDWHYNSLRLSEEMDYPAGQANALGNIANVNESLNKYDEALEIYSRILNIFKELGDELKYANTLMNMGVIYFYQSKYNEALGKFKESLDISERLNDKLIVSYTLNNIACTYEALNNYRETFNYFNKALDVSRSMDNKWSIANTLNNLAATNIKLGEFPKSEQHVSEALEIANSIGSTDLIAESHKIMSNLYEEKGDYKKALVNFKLFKELDDSLYNERSHEQIAEIRAKYESEKNEKAIQDLHIQEQSRVIIFVSVTAILIFIIALVNYMQYRYKKKAAQLLKTIIDSLTHPFCVFTVPERELSLSNKSAGYSNSPYRRFIENPVQALKDPGFPYTFYEVIESKKEYTLEKLVNINGKDTYYEFYGFPVLDGEDNVTKVIEYAVDITEEKLAIDKIKTAFEREKELNDLKSQFISSTSHEFRTPLATLYSSVELIQHYDKTGSENKKLYHIARIKGIVKYMTSMLDDILTINRAEANRLEFQPDWINLRDFCNEIMEDIVVLASSQHFINQTIEGDCDNLLMDTKLLRHILSNLLSNALKYSPEGGQILFKTIVDDDQVTFTVRDEGIGIPDNDLKNLFQHFFRASNVGTISGAGLGLAIVKKAVTVHGGTLNYESEVGKGTTFIVKLPLRKEHEPSLIG